MATPLLTCNALAARLGDPALSLIDLRLAADGGREAYRNGHIPGAVFSDYAADGWRQRIGMAPGMLPDEAHLAALFAKLGISPASHVVLIPTGASANDLAASARAYWTLKICGHADVSILDGGTQGWIRNHGALDRGDQVPVTASPYPIRMMQGLRARTSDVEEAVGTSAHVLVDARSPRYFAGLEKAQEAGAAGHIPGAYASDYVLAFDAASGALRPKPELEALFAAIPAGPVISYCNTGHTAALSWFALSEILGRPDVRLYDGSMTAWTEDARRAVATTQA